MMILDGLALNLDKREVISVVGGGGKTNFINALSKELKQLGKKVLSSTTTQIFKPEYMDYFFLQEIPKDFVPEEGTITVYGNYVKNGKLTGTERSKIDDLIKRDIFDYILIEADGSKGKPLKAPADHEPVISSLSTITVGVVGLDSIGKALDDSNFHRSALISKLIDKKIGDSVCGEDIVKLILNRNGTFKKSVGKKILILNKANSDIMVMEGKNIRNKLSNMGMSIIISNIKTKEFY